ncbi:malignant fibrous histiocytoma-amplified sequence 1 homolog [Sinocyclocheilus rhinocerous]|uniref:malignant fibrous histiocytoma-amplified sequence 1 homolog n=1 Tax=Sinocyclocheilus rhinocerous TaxID=307959 RepID=UPI0007B9C86C|nr:PREDICTED: malignant fibrous histiocytoma-amplified sequence 1 homolog [Sinocyclocheilus rhinocerous]
MSVLNGNQNAKKEEDFAGKKLKALPHELLQRGGDAVKVDLQRNRLKQITGINQLKSLTELNLSRNEFSDFPVDIRGLHQLEKLYINQNTIKTIPENVFPSLEKLRFLKLSTNRLEKLPQDMNRCQHLNYLNLSNNCLRNLDALVGLSHLKELYVERNQLTELPDLLFQNRSLTLFKASGNPLRKPPQEVCAGGLRDIESYFAMLEANAPNVCTVKTMFLGSSMAGKSTLCRSLKQGRPVSVAEEDRTVGIEISEVGYEGVRFFFWDFAGQEEYYITHHVFITAQAFVILAINLSSYNMDAQSFKENVGFWIKNLQLKIPDSVVLLVGTHVDQCTNENEVKEKKKHIEEQVKEMLETHTTNLEHRRKNFQEMEDSSPYCDQIYQIERLTEYKLKVVDLVPIDCTEQADIDKLHTRIKNEVLNKETFPSIEQTLPRCYCEVENDIQDLLKNGDIAEHGIASQTALLYELKNRHATLDDDKLKLILQYLHRIGVIMWYKEIPELAGSLFVKPPFLISLFKTIVRHDLVQELNKISSAQLKSENALAIQKKRWISDYKDRASLNNVAIRILVRTELQKNYDITDEELIEEVVGSKKREGCLLSLLKHFDVCLSTKHNGPLNPKANEFCPKKDWVPSNPIVYEPDACLFPSYLPNNKQVEQKWESDNTEDLNIHVYFLPEIPHGFFHRLVIRTCSLYSPYWIGKDQCVLCCGDRRFLLRERCDEDQFIEIRCKESELETSEDIQKAWEVIREIMIRLNTLTEQWQGLYLTVHSPCKSSNCDEYFQWNDWQEWLDDSGTSKFNVGLEEKQTCHNGHQRRTELLFPRTPDA